MAFNLPALIIPLLMEDKQFREAIKNAQKEAGSLVNGLSAVGGAVVGAGLGVAAAGIAGLTGLLFDSAKGAGEAEKIQSQLNAVIKSTGGVAGMTVDAVNELATSLQSVTAYEDDQIVATENMILTFTGIGKNVFPQVTEAALDMATAMGTDTKSAALMLGKSLNSPKDGLSALTRNGVVFTDEQKRMIEQMQLAGDVEGAQKVILEELAREFGGSARAVGASTEGVWTKVGNIFGGIKDTIGSSLLPAVKQLGTKVAEWLSSPEVQSAVNRFATWIGEMSMTIVNGIPLVLNGFQRLVTFLQSNQGIILAVLAALGVAIGAFIYTTVIPALVAFAVASWPVLAVMAAVGLAAYLLYQAWQTNFLGIRTFLTNLWLKIEPIFRAIVDWLKTNIPIAIQAVSDWFNTKFLPVLQAIWHWIYVNLLPVFRAIGNFLGAVFGKALEALAGLWQNVLYPALQKIWAFLSDKFGPIFKEIGQWIQDKVVPAFKKLGDILWEVAKFFNKLAYEINNLKLPKWLTPGSPMPLTIAMWGLNDSLKEVAKNSLPELNAQLNIQGVISPTAQNIQGNDVSSLIPYLDDIRNKKGTDEKKFARELGTVILKGLAGA